MTNFIRAMVRPVITVGLILGAIAMLLADKVPPEWYVTATTMAMAFWFGGRIGGQQR